MDQYIAPLSQVFVLALLGAMGTKGYEQVKQYWHEAKAQEWMIILRNGEQLRAAVGMKTFVWPGDTIITFPGKLREVRFTAEQVTQEMQGVTVEGMIVWSIFREGDGPFKCYKSFGDDLKVRSALANEKIMNLSKSIIRDRIANMSINDILKNRSKLRDGVKEEIQKLINGWGIWLETVEILDVLIASGTLFKNLQTEFRENTRQQSETIAATIRNELRNEEIERDAYISQIENTHKNTQDEFQAEQDLNLMNNEKKILEEKIKLDLKQKELANQNLSHERTQKDLIAKAMLEEKSKLAAIVNKHTIQDQILVSGVDAIKAENAKLQRDFLIKKLNMEKAQNIKHDAENLDQQSKNFSEAVLQKKLIEAHRKIIENCQVQSLTVVNIGEQDMQNSSAGAVMGQIMATSQAITGAQK